MFLWFPVLDLARAPRRTARKKGSGYENGETTSNDGYESEPSYTVEKELRDDEDVLAKTDEPLADDSWVEEYMQRQEQHTREIEELSLRLSGENPVSSW